MPKVPHPGRAPSSRDEGEGVFVDLPGEATPEIEEHIRHADYWAADWRLHELEFEQESRRSDHRKYLFALHKVGRDYSNQVLGEFPLGVARWLAQEAENVCNGLPSQVLKSSDECVQTANVYHENQFNLLWEEWGRQENNPALVLQTLSKAKELAVLPPDWVLRLLVDAGSKVYESDGDIDFGEALGLTPKKIKEARTAQKKVWVADLVAEALDSGLSSTEAKELAIFEAELVYGWRQYAPSTVQKYYEEHADERDGFGRSFMYCLRRYGLGSDNVYHSIRLPSWRRKVLKIRLEAYREAVGFYPDTQDAELDRAQRLSHVVSKTVAALRRHEPTKNHLGGFV